MGDKLLVSQRRGLAMPSRQQLLRFLTSLLIGLVGGLALLVAITLLPAVVGFYPMVVVSGSMEPAIHVGDIAVVRKLDPYALQIGDVVTYSTAEGNITHRIVGLDVTPQGPFFLMRGDANLTADPRMIPAQAIVGKVVYCVPWLGFWVSFANSTAGHILFFATLLALLWSRRAIRRHGSRFSAVYRVLRMGLLASFINSAARRILSIVTLLLQMALRWLRRTIRRRGPPSLPEGPSQPNIEGPFSTGRTDPENGNPGVRQIRYGGQRDQPGRPKW